MRTSGKIIAGLFVLVTNFHCINSDISFLELYNIKGEVLRAATFQLDEDGDQNVFRSVQTQTVDWSEGTLYAYLLPGNIYDSPDCGTKSSPSSNDFQVCATDDGATQVANPFDVNQKSWLDEDNEDTALEYTGIYDFLEQTVLTFVSPMSPIEEGSPVAILEFIGVPEGVYDIVLFADVNHEMYELTVDGEPQMVSARSVGCLTEDGADCYTKEDQVGLPSNGDVMYMIDNVVVNEENEDQFENLFLPAVDTKIAIYYPENSPDPNPCKTGNPGLQASGDHDFWDEWICVKDRHDLSGNPAASTCGVLVDKCFDNDTEERIKFPDIR